MGTDGVRCDRVVDERHEDGASSTPATFRWRLPSADHVLRDRRRADLDADPRELASDARRPPADVRSGHTPDQSPDLLRDGWATGLAAPAQLRPVLAELPLPPPDDRSRLHDLEDALPARPDPGQPSPEDPVGRPESGTRHRSLSHGELVPQGEDFELKGGARPEERGEEGEERSADVAHGRRP